MPEPRKIAVLNGHNSRVLFMALSPDGSHVVTGAGDETLRFWEVFPGNKGYGVSKMMNGNTQFTSERNTGNSGNSGNNGANGNNGNNGGTRDVQNNGSGSRGRSEELPSIRLKKDISILDSLR